MNNKKFDISVYKLNAKYKGKQIIETHFKSTKERTREEIIQAIKKAQKLSINNKLNFDFIVGLKYEGGWRNDKIFSATDEPKLWLIEDHEYEHNDKTKNKKFVKPQETFKEFVLYSIPKSTEKGGIGNNNDCLYFAIRSGLNGSKNMATEWNSPTKFKNRLDIEAPEMVSIKYFPKIENGLKVNLNCFGDYSYVSKGTYLRTVNLKLINNHYILDDTKLKKYDISVNPKEVAFFEIRDNKYIIITKEKKWEVQKSEAIYINSLYPEYFFLNQTGKIGKKKTLEILFSEFNNAREELIKETNGFIDLYKTPYMKDTARRIAFFKTQSIMKPETINNLESEWIDKSFLGGLMHSDNGQYDNAVSIDQNSMYSYYMSHNNFYIPYKAGEFKYIEQLENVIPYGIYRCIITSTDNTKNKLFRFNNMNYYTHFDLANARKLNFNIELIKDDEANALIYSSDKRIQGSKIYGETIKYLYELKAKIKYTKNIISALWGGLCEKTYKKYVVKSESDIVDIDDNAVITTISKYDDCSKIKCHSRDKVFKTDYARIGCFLTSYCRFHMSSFLKSNILNLNNIKRIHTDGAIVQNENIKKDTLGQDIGKFKIEHQGTCIIENVNNITWI